MPRMTRFVGTLETFRSNRTQCYLFAVVMFGLALLVRFLVDPYLPTGFPFITFFPAVIITAFFCGLGPGIVVSVLSFFASWYFFLPPGRAFDLSGSTAVALAFFASVLVVDLAIIESLLRSLTRLRDERLKSTRLAEQRDTLFRELQHRIGNNLQAISALLSIQARSITDPDARASLQEATQRISTIADIQRMFHDPNRAEGTIDTHFVNELVRKCLTAAGVEDQVEVTLEITAMTLPQDVFMPVALVLTECVNNAIEHAVQAKSATRIGVALARDSQSGEVTLSVADDGPGPPEGFDPARAKSIGMMVITSFARQISGAFAIRHDGRTRSELVFKVPGFA